MITLCPLAAQGKSLNAGDCNSLSTRLHTSMRFQRPPAWQHWLKNSSKWKSALLVFIKGWMNPFTCLLSCQWPQSALTGQLTDVVSAKKYFVSSVNTLMSEQMSSYSYLKVCLNYECYCNKLSWANEMSAEKKRVTLPLSQLANIYVEPCRWKKNEF